MSNTESGLRPPYLVLALSAVLVVAVALGTLNFDDDDEDSPASKAGTETRTVAGNARGIELVGPIDAVIRIGATQSIEVEGDDALRSQITTELNDGVLRIGLASSAWKNAHLRARVTLPALEKIRITGSGNASINGLNGGALAVTIDGSGDIDSGGQVDRLDATLHESGDLNLGSLTMHDATVRSQGTGEADLGRVTNGKVEIEIRGSGGVTIRGQAQRLEATMAGTGDLDASDLETQEARLELRGSGDATVNVQRKLDVIDQGYGEITQHGSAPVTTTK